MLHDNREASRYELSAEGTIAFVTYLREPDRITFIHAEVPESLRGQGIGARLARAVVCEARAQGLHVVARCPFIASYLREHPELEG